MDLSQITLCQTARENQFTYDAVAADKAILRAMARRRALSTWCTAMFSIVSALFKKLARHLEAQARVATSAKVGAQADLQSTH